jgi:hypothetical protein
MNPCDLKVAHALLDGREDEVWISVWLLHCLFGEMIRRALWIP